MCVTGMPDRIHEIIIDAHLRTRNDRHQWLALQRRKTTNDVRGPGVSTVPKIHARCYC